jgi:hypothetical protein
LVAGTALDAHSGRSPRPAGSAQQVEISLALLIKAGDLVRLLLLACRTGDDIPAVAKY